MKLCFIELEIGFESWITGTMDTYMALKKKRLQLEYDNLLILLARPGRLERPTCGFVVRRSIHLSYGRLIYNHTTSLVFRQA